MCTLIITEMLTLNAQWWVNIAFCKQTLGNTSKYSGFIKTDWYTLTEQSVTYVVAYFIEQC